MTYAIIAISSGHGQHVRGASGIIDEVDEARTVVDLLALTLRERGVMVFTFHDDTSRTQSENLDAIVNFHNEHVRDLDISVHFNAYEPTSKAMGTEVLYVTQAALAEKLSAAIASVGLLDRGAKYRSDLFFLNNTHAPAVLLEVCFVDSEADCVIYDNSTSDICSALADALTGAAIASTPPATPTPAQITGRVSSFGGPDDGGVLASEGLAFINDIMQAPHLFLPYQPKGTTGLARRLNPFVHYIACRWDYDLTPKSALLYLTVMVHAPATGIELEAFPADWGPHEDTGRIADLSPQLMADLGIETDDTVVVTMPHAAAGTAGSPTS
jgi:N-acetylmuramoyl-L-alanine amidase